MSSSQQFILFLRLFLLTLIIFMTYKVGEKYYCLRSLLKNEAVHHSVDTKSKDTAQEFDQLSPEEAKKRLKMIVEKMDKNQDRGVDSEELENWVLRSFRMLSQEKSQERFEENDSNDDGKSEDFAEEQKMLQMLKKLEEIFRVTVLNRVGYLDEEEFLGFIHPEEHEHPLKIIYKRTMDEKDTAKDGSITFQEFVGMEGRGHDKEWLISEKDRFDNDYDINGDGKLNKRETLLWLVSNDVAKLLIKIADDNKNGVLSEREILDHHYIFLGCLVTSENGNYFHNMKKLTDEL